MKQLFFGFDKKDLLIGTLGLYLGLYAMFYLIYLYSEYVGFTPAFNRPYENNLAISEPPSYYIGDVTILDNDKQPK
jgi:hypothetical protein